MAATNTLSHFLFAACVRPRLRSSLGGPALASMAAFAQVCLCACVWGACVRVFGVLVCVWGACLCACVCVWLPACVHLVNNMCVRERVCVSKRACVQAY
jgi:low affinity Fe/Cu permease